MTESEQSDHAPKPQAAPAFTPYVPASESPAEFTIKAVIPGVIFGIAFGAANAYLGLQAGLTISTSIPVAVMSVAAFRAMRGFGVTGTLLEANMAQTIGSASSSVASGVIFTLPALFMWGFDPHLLQMTMLALCGGLLGVLFMVPLRAYLIEREHGKLPYPEGTACAEVLIASEVGGGKAANVFLGLGFGALFKFIIEWLKILPGKVVVAVPFLPKAEVGTKMSAALFGVGYILGVRVAAVMVGGGLLSALVVIPIFDWWGAGLSAPFYPETERLIRDMSAHDIWDRYVRYIGAGAVAAAGIITLIRSIPTMIESFRIGARQIGQRFGSDSVEVPRTRRDLPLGFVAIGALLIAVVMAVVPNIFGTIETASIRFVAAICVTIFSFFFVTVASRIVGLVGVTSNPTSGMTIASLLGTATIFRLMGWTDETGMIAALTVGCVVAIAASIAGDTSQDLKTGFLLGATPRRQQIGELIGVLTSATAVCATVIMLNASLTLGSADLPAPQATLMKLVIGGVLQSELPWSLVAIGVGITLAAEIARIPSLPFAVGVYLPVTTMVPVFFGGALRWFMERGGRTPESKTSRRENGVLFGSGLVGGEGLLGVLVAGIVFFRNYPPVAGRATLPPWGQVGAWASDGTLELLASAAFASLALVFAWRCRKTA